MSQPTAPPPPLPHRLPGKKRESDWFQRNWKWLVPLGCGGALLVVLVMVGGIFGTFYFIAEIVKSSGAYQQALARAQEHPEVQAALGTPIEAGWFVFGSVNYQNDDGVADLSFFISGPEGDGSVYADATKTDGQWSFHTLAVDITATGERIDLLE